MPDGTYPLADLCGLADVTPRTVRYYITLGLLRSPGTTGPAARYDDGHLARLRLIRRLQREHQPLAEIRARLAAMTDDEAVAEADAPTEPPTDSALDYVRGVLGGRALRVSPGGLPSPPPPGSPRSMPRTLAGSLRERFEAGMPLAAEVLAAPERSHWERYTLAPGVELHVRRPLTRSQNRAVARLVETAHQLLEENQP